MFSFGKVDSTQMDASSTLLNKQLPIETKSNGIIVDILNHGLNFLKNCLSKEPQPLNRSIKPIYEFDENGNKQLIDQNQLKQLHKENKIIFVNDDQHKELLQQENDRINKKKIETSFDTATRHENGNLYVSKRVEKNYRKNDGYIDENGIKQSLDKVVFLDDEEYIEFTQTSYDTIQSRKKQSENKEIEEVKSNEKSDEVKWVSSDQLKWGSKSFKVISGDAVGHKLAEELSVHVSKIKLSEILENALKEEKKYIFTDWIDYTLDEKKGENEMKIVCDYMKKFHNQGKGSIFALALDNETDFRNVKKVFEKTHTFAYTTNIYENQQTMYYCKIV